MNPETEKQKSSEPVDEKGAKNAGPGPEIKSEKKAEPPPPPGGFDLERMKMKMGDYKVFLREGFEIVTSRDEKIKVPPLTGKVEKEVVLAMMQFIVSEGNIFKEFSSGKNPGIMGLFKYLVGASGEKAFKTLQKMSAALLGKSEEWVDQHLLLTDLVEVVRPFFVIEVGLIKNKFGVDIFR